jgi:ABC-type nitrate/sulfonate/bicarbonate transport system substrate-binding protein
MQISRQLGVTTSLLALLATVCIGLSTPSPAATATAAAKIKVRYGLPTAPPAITTVGVYYALDNGYFAEQGLDVEVMPADWEDLRNHGSRLHR